jgi:aminopeptidase N
MLAMVREFLGAQRFDQALRSFYAQSAFRRPTLDNFQNSFGTFEAMQLPMFFSQWIDRHVLPRLTVEALGEPGKAIVLRVNQTEPAFSLPLELRLAQASGCRLS